MPGTMADEGDPYFEDHFAVDGCRPVADNPATSVRPGWRPSSAYRHHGITTFAGNDATALTTSGRGNPNASATTGTSSRMTSAPPWRCSTRARERSPADHPWRCRATLNGPQVSRMPS